MLAAVSREIEGKPRFMAMSEDERASYANTVAKHFADQVLAEANYRGTTLDAILSASDITYDRGIRLERHINLFDALKNPEMIPPETKLKRESLLAFLKRKGGVIDEGGDIKSRGAIKEYPGLINKKGMTLDDAALMAWEHGYFTGQERPTINDLLDAIDESLRGNHRYNVEEERTFTDALDDLEQELDRMDIDWRNMTAAEIEKAVDELPELQSLEREAAFYEQFEPEIGLSEDEAERLAIETEGKEYPIIDEKDLPERYYQREISDEELEADLAEFDKILDSFAEENKEYYNKKGKFEDAKKIQKKYQNYFMYNIADASNPRGIHDTFYFEYDGKKDITNIWTPKKLEKSSNIILYRGAEQIFVPVNEFDKSKFKKLGFKRQKVFDEGLRDIYTENKEEKSDNLRDFERIDGKYVRKPETYYQSAFAGSRVDYDRPSLEAIGSGEGAQAHGWGLYYALNKDVAERYRENFTRGARNLEYDGKEIKYMRLSEKKKAPALKRVIHDFVYNSFDDISDMIPEKLQKMKDYYEREVRNSSVINDKERGRLAAENLEALKDFDISKLKEKKQGQVHEVDIPENPYLLDEQKPFSEQSDIVKKGIIDTLNSMNLTEKQKEKFRNNIENRRDTGKEIYEELVVAMGTSRGDGLISSSKENMPLVSKALAENGVKGITYFGRQDGRCFVIFNPADVRVIQKFYQRGKNAKGYTNITPDEYIIKLLEDADESTLPHELAHYWLTEMWNYTRTGRASENYMKRWQIISDYLGIKPEQTRLTRGQQEKFASSYLMIMINGCREYITTIIKSIINRVKESVEYA